MVESAMIENARLGEVGKQANTSMRVLIVHAHHEPESFNGAMLAVARETLLRAGHEVQVSDLYAMRFDPVSDRRNFTTVANPLRLDQQSEEIFAVEHGGFAADVAAEIEKLQWCDVLLLQFPLWWMGMPAILKGWIDRVFTLGVTYGGGRWFDKGRLAGKRAMLSLTVGAPEAAYSCNGLYGSIATILYPLSHGILAFVGFSVLEPFVVYGPGRLDAAGRAAELARFRERIGNLYGSPVLPAVRSDDYVNWRRRLD
jgi:NAD(P)H dehydrogenase (quinone)